MIDLAPHNPYALTITAPLVAASGAVGFGVEVARPLGFGQPEATHGLGAIITRTLIPDGQWVGPQPMLLETPAGLIYHPSTYGNLRLVRERYAPVWASWTNLPVIVSVAGSDPREVAALARELEMLEMGGVAGVEVALALCAVPTLTAAAHLVRTVRNALMLPLLVKLPIDAPERAELAQALVAAGADALVVGDGPRAAAVAGTGTIATGRLCGPAIRPLALLAVAEVCAAVAVPVIGMGGVTSAADAQALLAVGASAVGLGSALLTDLRSAARITAALDAG